MANYDSSSAVMEEGIGHGDDLSNTRRQHNKKHEIAGVFECNYPKKRVHNNNNDDDDDDEYASSFIDGANEKVVRGRKRRRLSSRQGDDPPIPTKKPRFVWTADRHQQFLNAVIRLGINDAVTRKILELMNIPSLTREIIASHLQKFKLRLKKISDETQQQNGVLLNGTTKSKLGASKRFNMQALAADTGHVSPQTQTQAGLHAEFTGYNYPAGGNIRSKENHIPLLKPPIQELNYFGTSNYETNIAKNFPHQPLMAVDDALSSGYNGSWEWPSFNNAIGSEGLSSGIGERQGVVQNVNELMNIAQEYQPTQQQLQLLQSLIHDLIYSDSVSIQQLSSLVGPYQPHETLQVGISPSPDSVNYNNNFIFGGNSLIDHGTLFSPQPNNSLSTIAELCGYTANSRTQQLHNNGAASARAFPGLPTVSEAPVPCAYGSIDPLHQGQVSIQSRSPINNTILKEQPNLINGAEVDHPV